MVKRFFGNLKKVWRCRKNFGDAGRKTHNEGYIELNNWNSLNFAFVFT